MKRSNISLAIAFVALASNAPAKDAAFSSAELTKRTMESRAMDAAIWGMPIVSFDVMRQGFFRDAKAHYGDIMYWSRFSTWKNQTTTPNTSTRYVIFFTNTKDGPVVVDVPPVGDAALFGTLLDAWQVPLVDVGDTGEDLGNGGKYLLLPPRYKGETPRGYIAVPSNTYNGFVAMRVISKTEQADDVRAAIAYLKQLKTYPLAAANSPPEQRYVDMADTLWDGIVRFDESFYKSLARMVNEELAQARDLEMLGTLRPLGIEKGKRFKPDADTRVVLKQASHEVHAWFMERLVNYGQRFWPDRKWDIPAPLIASETGFKCKQFWTFTVYDQETSSFIRRSARAGLDSYDEQMKRNPDGSVDLYTGPKPPKGQEANWIPTVAGKGWFPFFRFYGPDEPLFQKTWKLPDITRVK